MPKTHPKDSVAPDEIQESEIFVSQNDQAGLLQANTTFFLEAQKGKALGSGGETRAFGKPIVPEMDDNLGATTAVLFSQYDDKRVNGKLVQPGMLLRPEVGGDRGMLTRQVATYEADKFLKLNTISEEKYGISANDGSVFGVSIQADGAAVTSKKGRLDVDFSRPEIQRGLSDLEVSDFITGQVDRHPGNIFIDPVTGKVTGIDNDMGLPEVSREEMLKRDSALNAKMVAGMPKRMHQETAAKILAADPEELRATLSKQPPPNGPQPLSQEAIDGAVDRLKKLQAELQDPNGSIDVVDAFDNNTYQAAIDEQLDAFRNDPDVVQNKVSLDNTDPRDVGVFDTVAKTSYLGSIEMSKRKNALELGGGMALHSDAPKADRLKGYDHELLSKIKEAYPLMTKDQQKTWDKDYAKLQKLQDQVAQKEKHMLKPSFTDKLKAVAEGMGNVKQHKQDHIDNLNADIVALKDKMRNSCDGVTNPKQQNKVAFSEDSESIPGKSPSLKDSSSSNSVDGDHAVSGEDVGQDKGQKFKTATVSQGQHTSVRDALATSQQRKPTGTGVKQDQTKVKAGSHHV